MFYVCILQSPCFFLFLVSKKLINVTAYNNLFCTCMGSNICISISNTNICTWQLGANTNTNTAHGVCIYTSCRPVLIESLKL